MNAIEILNDKQKEAALHIDGPLLILAGAGSGKTRVITNRTAYMIQEVGINPYNILAITFTNKAAQEMRERINDIAGFGAQAVWTSTFHSLCARILRRYIDRIGFDTNYTIYDTDDQKAVIKEIVKRFNINTKMYSERSFLSRISAAKDELVSPEMMARDCAGDYGMQEYIRVYAEYQAVLRRNNALDFDDLIVKTVELFNTCPDVLDSYQERFKYIMVDEYQDTNTAQFELVRALAGKYRNICVVGDDDQSIYKFRGANIHNILDFEKYYPEAKVVRLEQNYRSTRIILDTANAVISNNLGRKSKTLWTDRDGGERVHLRQFETGYEEADFIAADIARSVRDGASDYRENAVLYRTNAQSRLLEEKLIMLGIPYNVVGGVNFYARREIKDILAYLKTIDNGRDDLSVKRIINVPKRGIGATTIAKVAEFAAINEMGLFDAMLVSEHVPGLSKAAVKLDGFTNMIRVFRAKACEMPVDELIRDVIDTTGYLAELESSDDPDADDRIENIEELISKAAAFAENYAGGNAVDDGGGDGGNPGDGLHNVDTGNAGMLSAFLAEVALVADIDNVDSDDNRVLLMTMHGAKGLEFKRVYIAGLEDGLFPSYMTISSDDPDEIEEERRLCYVGITRAMEELTLTYAKSRMVRGELQFNNVSRFIREMPQMLLDNTIPKSARREYYEDDGYGYDGRSGSYTGGGYRGLSGSGMGTGLHNYGFPGDGPTAVFNKKKPAIANKPFIATVDSMTRGKDITKSDGLDYKEGDRVRHIKFGTGTVLSIADGGRDYEVTVDFDRAGVKKMFAAFAKLVKIEG